MERAKPLLVSPERLEFLEFIKNAKGTPYLWGGKGYSWQEKGYDCSGLVTAGIYHATKGRLNWREKNCNKLYEATIETKEPEEGDLIFYGIAKNLLQHVMVYVGDTAYGSCGGGSQNTTIEYSMKHGAKVQARKEVRYRPDFKCFTKLPL